MSPKQVDPTLRAEAERLRYEERLSMRQISDRTGVGKGTLSYWFSARSRKATRARQEKKRVLKPRTCQGCGGKFTSKSPGQRYCEDCKDKPREPKARPKPTRAQRPTVNRRKGPPRQPKRDGRGLRGSPLALRIDRSVRDRLRAMEDD